MRVSLDYVAGFFDGEGSVCLARAVRVNRNCSIRYSIRCTVSQVHLPTLVAVHEAVGFGRLDLKRRKHSPLTTGLGSGHIVWSSAEGHRFCRLMQHRCIQKGPQMDVAAKFYEDFNNSTKGIHRWNPDEHKRRVALMVAGAEEAITKIKELRL